VPRRCDDGSIGTRRDGNSSASLTASVESGLPWRRGLFRQGSVERIPVGVIRGKGLEVVPATVREEACEENHPRKLPLSALGR